MPSQNIFPGKREMVNEDDGSEDLFCTAINICVFSRRRLQTGRQRIPTGDIISTQFSKAFDICILSKIKISGNLLNKT